MSNKKLREEANKVYFSIIEKAEIDPTSRFWKVKLNLANLEDESVRYLYNLIYECLIPRGFLTRDESVLPYTKGEEIDNINFPHKDFTIFFVSEELMSYYSERDQFIANYLRLKVKTSWTKKTLKFIITPSGASVTCLLLTPFFTVGLILLENYWTCGECEKTKRVQKEFIQVECLMGPTLECAGTLFGLNE